MAILIFSVAVIFGFILLIRIMSFALSQRSVNYYYSKEDEDREREMMKSVQYHRSPEPFVRAQNAPGTGPSSATVMSHNEASRSTVAGGVVGNGIFSPQENRVFGNEKQTMFDSRVVQSDSVYRSMSPITPSHSNSASTTRENRTPYSLNRKF